MISLKDYDKFTFLKKPNFVISSLENRLTVQRSKHENKVFSILMAGTAITLFLILTTLSQIMQITGLHPGIIIVAYLTIAGLILWRIIAKIQYNIDDTIRERTTSGDSNVKFDLGSAWRISPGGIQEDVDVGLGMDKSTVIVSYDTKAIFLKGIMKGTVDLADGDDYTHYKTLQRLQDIALQNGFEIMALNVPYNTDNDPIWDIETAKIHQAAELGYNYLKLRTQLHDMVYNFTKKNSTVSVTYYILKATLSARVLPDVLGKELTKLRHECVMDISGVSMKEMKTLMETYYGIMISIEDILSFMTVTTTSLGECKLISYTLPDGTLIDENAPYEYILKNNLGSNEIVGDFVPLVEERANNTQKSVDSTIEGDIFSRDYI